MESLRFWEPRGYLAVYLATMGPQGMRKTAELCLQKADYASRRITEQDGFSRAFKGPTFKEFVVRGVQADVDDLISDAATNGFLAGIPLGQWYPELADCFLVAVTEQRTKPEIDALAKCLANAATPSVVHA